MEKTFKTKAHTEILTHRWSGEAKRIRTCNYTKESSASDFMSLRCAEGEQEMMKESLCSTHRVVADAIKGEMTGESDYAIIQSKTRIV